MIRYNRIDQSDYTDPGGMGLGLYIGKEVIRNHRGDIWIESEEGLGSTFIVKLPSSMDR